MPATDMPVGLRIRALRVVGPYSLDIRFDDNRRFFVLQGENTSGKSTFMKLIIYGLGGHVPHLIPEAQQNRCVLLEVLVRNEVFTVERYISGAHPGLIFVCEGDIDHFAEERASVWSVDGGRASDLFQDFIADKLGFRDRQIISRRTAEVSRLSWNQLLSLVYVDQETSAASLFWASAQSEAKELKRKRLEAVFDLNLDQIDALEVERSELSRAQSQKDRDLKGVLKFLDDFGLTTEAGLIELMARIQANDKERALSSDAISKVKLEMKTRSTHLDRIRLEIVGVTEEIMQLEGDIVVALNRIEDYHKLLNELHVERERVAATGVVSSTLSLLKVDACPICFQSVDPTPHNEQTCPMCQQVIETHEPVEVDHLESLEDKIKDTLSVWTREDDRVRKMREQRRVLLQTKGDRERFLNEQVAGMVAPFLTEIEQQYTYLQQLELRAEDLRTKLRAYEQTQKYKNELREIVERFQVVQTRLNYLKKILQRQLPRYLSIMNEYLFDFLASGILPQIQRAEISPTLFVPIIDEREIDKLESASAKVVGRIGFFYSLLALATLTEVKHPRLLLLDSPRDKDLDQEKFDLIMSKFVSLVEASQVDCQIIITTSEITQRLEPHIFLRTYAKPGGYLLKKKNDRT